MKEILYNKLETFLHAFSWMVISLDDLIKEIFNFFVVERERSFD